MPWNTPVAPVSGTTITVAWAIANIVNPINWLRLLMGNADPPGSDYVVVSTGVAGASWQKVPIAALAIQPVNRQGDTMTGDLTVSRSTSGAPTEGVIYLGQNGSAVYLQYDATHHFNLFGGVSLEVDSDLHTWRAGAPSTGYVNLATGPAHFIGWDGSKFVMDGATAWHSGNDGAGSALDAGLLGGVAPSGYALAAAGVPSGLGGFFATAAGIAAGWARYTAADGRLLVGAGTTFSQTFTENTAYGANWTPFAGAGGFTGTAADTVNVTVSGSTPVSAASHQNALSIAAQTWVPVARAVVWATKT
jgi:hypothetical protein